MSDISIITVWFQIMRHCELLCPKHKKWLRTKHCDSVFTFSGRVVLRAPPNSRRSVSVSMNLMFGFCLGFACLFVHVLASVLLVVACRVVFPIPTYPIRIPHHTYTTPHQQKYSLGRVRTRTSLCSAASPVCRLARRGGTLMCLFFLPFTK